jgi:hypothetical protein
VVLSERTTNPRLALKSLSFFPKLTTQSYYFVLAVSCDFVRIGQGRKIVHVLALIERDDLVHAADAELFPVRLGDLVRRQLRIRPAEHRHHLALRAVGISRHLS